MMQTAEFLTFLKDNQMPVFTTTDAAKVLRKPRKYVKLFLHRCLKRGLISRAERGLYYLKSGVNEYVIASSVIRPSYVSMISALAYYGLTTQIPHVVYVLSTKRHRKMSGVMGYDIVFRRVKADMMFGYHKEAEGNISIADPEKAIVDIFHFRDVNDLDEDVLDKPSRIDVHKLADYASRSGERAVVRGVVELLQYHSYRKEALALMKSEGKR